jgi:hypothetical protein
MANRLLTRDEFMHDVVAPIAEELAAAYGPGNNEHGRGAERTAKEILNFMLGEGQ